MTLSVRAFIALQLPEKVSAALAGVQERLRAHDAARGLRWVDPRDAHLTVKFLGEVPVDHLPGIVEALNSVAEHWEPFTLRLESLGAFPNVHRPKVLWIGAETGRKAAIRFYNAVEVALKSLGIRPERSEFIPHVTLARLPKGWSAAERAAIGNLIGTVELPPVPPFTVAAVALMRSVLTQAGPEYSRLGNSRFGESPPLQADDWADEE